MKYIIIPLTLLVSGCSLPGMPKVGQSSTNNNPPTVVEKQVPVEVVYGPSGQVNYIPLPSNAQRTMTPAQQTVILRSKIGATLYKVPEEKELPTVHWRPLPPKAPIGKSGPSPATRSDAKEGERNNVQLQMALQEIREFRRGMEELRALAREIRSEGSSDGNGLRGAPGERGGIGENLFDGRSGATSMEEERRPYGVIQ